VKAWVNAVIYFYAIDEQGAPSWRRSYTPFVDSIAGNTVAPDHGSARCGCACQRTILEACEFFVLSNFWHSPSWTSNAAVGHHRREPFAEEILGRRATVKPEKQGVYHAGESGVL